jgi:hypothetical protein
VDVCRFTSVPWTYTPSAARAWVRRGHDRRSAGTGLALAVTREGHDAALGNVNLVRFSDDGREAALGWRPPGEAGPRRSRCRLAQPSTTTTPARRLLITVPAARGAQPGAQAVTPLHAL